MNNRFFDQAIFVGPEFGTVSASMTPTTTKKASSSAKAYFLGANDPYKALKTTLKAEINGEAWATLHSDTSRPGMAHLQKDSAWNAHFDSA